MQMNCTLTEPPPNRNAARILDSLTKIAAASHGRGGEHNSSRPASTLGGLLTESRRLEHSELGAWLVIGCSALLVLVFSLLA